MDGTCKLLLVVSRGRKDGPAATKGAQVSDDLEGKIIVRMVRWPTIPTRGDLCVFGRTEDGKVISKYLERSARSIQHDFDHDVVRVCYRGLEPALFDVLANQDGWQTLEKWEAGLASSQDTAEG